MRLPRPSDRRKPGESPPAVPVDSTNTATSVTAWWDDYQWAWLRETEAQQKRWDRRSRNETLTGNQRAYASRRANALGMDVRSRVEACDEWVAVMQCGCRRFKVRTGCGQRWHCERCNKRHWRSVRKRLHKSTKMHRVAKERAGFRNQWRWVLMTLTVRHSGDPSADRTRLLRGWARMRAWLAKRIGKFPFAMTFEVTEGRDSRGHVHAHGMVLWPFIDWAEVAAEWKRAIDDEGASIDLKQARKGGGGAAEYIAKYVSKGFKPRELPAVLAAKVSAAFYNKRSLTVSERFWRKLQSECKECGSGYECTKKPKKLIAAIPFEGWRSLARARGVQSNRVGWGSQTEASGLAPP